MGTLIYVRLIGYTAGTLLMLFWMVVILGYRRQRNFERVLFFLCLALFLVYGGSLLALNARLYYWQPPPLLTTFASTILGSGLSAFPTLLYHLHLEFADTRGIGLSKIRKRFALTLAYIPPIYFLLLTLPIHQQRRDFDFAIPGDSLGTGFALWFFFMALLSCRWEWKFALDMKGRPECRFHRLLWLVLVLVLLLLVAVHFSLWPIGRSGREWIAAFFSLLPLGPLTVLIYFVRRHNFLNIGRQRNLLYAVSATFVALLYLAFVRRISESLAVVLPPEATAAVLLFVLVVFIEPLQRFLGRSLQETARREMERVHALTGEIQLHARQGNLEALTRFIARRTRETFELNEVKANFHRQKEITEAERVFAKAAGIGPLTRGKPTVSFSEGKVSDPFIHGGTIGVLRVEPHGFALSGETRAALESLCEQLPAAIELCCAVEDKVRLERELAERERLAALGQMAASISHNLKNPLGSIKTILQVQLENPEMPDSLKSETQMVLAEISRLSNKLAQLLQFSRPALLGDAGSPCDAAEVAKEVTKVLRHEAERKGIRIEVSSNGNLPVAVGRESLNDILSNLIVNALEAAPANGSVSVSVTQDQERAVIRVEDDGKGIPADLREKVLQPFFTTKTQGTGLGLAIVSKRVAEASGTLELESPIAAGRGTRFCVRLPLRES